ncbi:MAG: SocA family protein [Planctomycetes bacterium]|nr:SocA family protein [Planctomycetota bacterium]
MSYPARTIANWFLSRAARDGDALTQMKLQKLVYIAHGWHLGLYGEPLIMEDVEAWRWGPVIKALYRDFADFGSSPITAISPTLVQVDNPTNLFLERVWSQYGKFSAVQLSAMTHAPNTPWSLNYGGESQTIRTIPSSTIEQHYKEKLANA